MSVDLSLAHTDVSLIRPLRDGEVEPEGVDLTVLTEPDNPSKLYRRMWQYEEIDASEMGMGTVLSLGMVAEYPFTAIPVFTDRIFRQSFMYTHTDTDVNNPADLVGKEIGTQAWDGSAGIWLRGIAAEHYGLDPTTVRWHLERPLQADHTIPDRFDTTVVPDRSFEQLVAMLEAGKIDALFHPRIPGGLKDPNSTIERLFDDPESEERAYYAQTGIFPIMHTVVVHDDVLADHPWVARNLLEAFKTARDQVLTSFADPDWTPFVMALHHRENQLETFGQNPWEYGLTADNRRDIDTLLGYAHNQGLTPERYEPEDLFVPSTVDNEM